MLKEIKSFIPTDKELNVIDATFGGGGYSKSILKSYRVKKLIAIDRDPISKVFAKEIEEKYSEKFNLVNGCFSEIDQLIASTLSIKNKLLKFDIIIFFVIFYFFLRMWFHKKVVCRIFMSKSCKPANHTIENLLMSSA